VLGFVATHGGDLDIVPGADIGNDVGRIIRIDIVRNLN
jgi:hypothetical protein